MCRSGLSTFYRCLDGILSISTGLCAVAALIDLCNIAKSPHWLALVLSLGFPRGNFFYIKRTNVCASRRQQWTAVSICALCGSAEGKLATYILYSYLSARHLHGSSARDFLVLYMQHGPAMPLT